MQTVRTHAPRPAHYPMTTLFLTSAQIRSPLDFGGLLRRHYSVGIKIFKLRKRPFDLLRRNTSYLGPICSLGRSLAGVEHSTDPGFSTVVVGERVQNGREPDVESVSAEIQHNNMIPFQGIIFACIEKFWTALVENLAKAKCHYMSLILKSLSSETI